MDKFTFEEVFLAYKKLKNYYYHDNTSLFIKKRIAEFEKEIKFGDDLSESLENKFNRVVDLLNSPKKKIIKFISENINCKITPKALKKEQRNLLTNRTNINNIVVDRLNVFIDVPVEIHLISVLWIKFIGVHVNKLIDEDNYAYKLIVNEDANENENTVNGYRIFKPYYKQYQKWRDSAIEKVEDVLRNKKDAVILSLDIYNYFHSVNFSFERLACELSDIGFDISFDTKSEKLFELIDIINTLYTEKLNKLQNTNYNSALPIGLLSSGVLANYYLKDFDEKIKSELNPYYYGRYVDDIMLVLTNVKVSQQSVSPVNTFLNDYFIKRKILKIDKEKTGENVFISNCKKRGVKFKDLFISDFDEKPDLYIPALNEANKVRFKLDGFENLKIQSTKVMLQDFHYKESPALINKFKKNIEKNRSEFRYLPNEEEIDKEFDEDAFYMQYDDSVNKLRSVKEFREDKYGASKYLAKKIFSASFSETSNEQSKDSNQILTFFKGEIAVEFHTLWEKVATFFIINNNHKGLSKFFNKTRLTINNIDFDEDPELGNQIQKDLLEYLKISISIPIAYNLKFKLHNLFKVESADETIMNLAVSFRKANLFKHNWISIPALNYTKYASLEEFSYSLLERDKKKLNKKFTNGNLDLCLRAVLLAPRYVQFHEVNILKIHQTISGINLDSGNIPSVIAEIPDKAFDDYWKMNFEWKESCGCKGLLDVDCIKQEENCSKKNSLKESYFHIGHYKDNQIVTTFSKLNRQEVDKKIALANITMKSENIELAFLNKPNTNKERREQLFQLMNDVEREGADVFVLPEVSVPNEWISLLSHQANKSDTCIIAGLEHWVNNAKIAFNFMAVILPIDKGAYKTNLISLRLKNHYSPDENKVLKGYGLCLPRELDKKFMPKYTLFNWKGVYFSTYNCFELANINDRAIFKSKVDFIVASEYNRDINYFSNIAGSWVRDVHCYFIQVNASDFGDSRILQPSSSVSRNILQIKGGDNSFIIVGVLKINKLREFQMKDHYLQKEDGTFKPTPPDFDTKYVEKRINNDPIVPQ